MIVYATIWSSRAFTECRSSERSRRSRARPRNVRCPGELSPPRRVQVSRVLSDITRTISSAVDRAGHRRCLPRLPALVAVEPAQVDGQNGRRHGTLPGTTGPGDLPRYPRHAWIL